MKQCIEYDHILVHVYMIEDVCKNIYQNSNSELVSFEW